MSNNSYDGPLQIDVPLYEDGSLSPLRSQDLIDFFTERKRTTSCPHCTWQGGWEIAMNEEDLGHPNPKLEIFVIKSAYETLHSSAAVVCPNCGHFAQVATYKIRQYLQERGER